MTRFNKATAATIGTAVTTVLGAVWAPGPEVLAAVNTLLVAVLVYLVPNRE